MMLQKSDILDKISILILKVIHDVGVSDELLELLSDFMPQQDAMVFVDLLLINSKIWNLEADIRQGKELSLEEIGKRALAIRDINKKRIAVKNTLSKYKEIKIDHASA